MYGKLTVVTGCMFSGKTSYIIREIKNTDSIILKPAMDIRYSEGDCVSHDGIACSAISVSLPIHLTKAENNSLVCFDEIQFFAEPYFRGDIVKCIKILLRAGKDVIANGLDMDWKGDAFAVTSQLCGIADEVIKLKAKCNVCGSPASKTFKKSVAPDEVIVELGNEDKYEARCNAHWHSHSN